MAEKSYADLKREVWDTGLCARCGACVAVCPAEALFFAREIEGESPLSPESTGYCKMETDGVPCGACYRACPRTGERNAPSSLLGDTIEVFAARAAFPVAGKQSGGAVTAILKSALEEGTIDAVVTVTADPWTLEPRSTVITDAGVLAAHAGSRYNCHVPLLAALKQAVVEQKHRNIAMVGVPCAVQAARRIRESDFDLLRPFGKAIRLVIGLFCTESFDYARLVEEELRRERGIEPWAVRRLDVKGALEVTLDDGTIASIPLAELDSCIPAGCKSCTDFAALDADISAGAVGSPDGFTTLLVRTPTGRGFVDRARTAGVLETTGEVTLAPAERLAARKAKRGKK
jgi:coenzyme F420 hydrogenase subunit beta